MKEYEDRKSNKLQMKIPEKLRIFMKNGKMSLINNNFKYYWLKFSN